MIFLFILIVVIAVFALVVFKNLKPKEAAVLPFNNNLTRLEIEIRTQAQKLLTPMNTIFLNIQKNFNSQRFHEGLDVNKLFKDAK